MASFNFFEEYRKEHNSGSSVFNKRRLADLFILLLVALGAIYAVLYFKNTKLQDNIEYVQNIKSDPKFLEIYSDSLAISDECDDIDREMELINTLKSYEIASNSGNYSLLDLIDECIPDNISIDGVQLSNLSLVIEGRAVSTDDISESIRGLRNSGSFENIICTYAKNDGGEEDTSKILSFELSMELVSQEAEETGVLEGAAEEEETE